MFILHKSSFYKTTHVCLATVLMLAACGGGGGGGSNSTASDVAAGSSSLHSGEAEPASSTPDTASPGTAAPQVPTPAPSTSDPTPPPAPAPATPPASTTPAPVSRLIEYYGDSTVYGYETGKGGQVAEPAPAAFAKALPASANYQVRNEGVSATTACQLLNGTDGVHPAWSKQMASSKASYVIINHAINDEWREDLATYKSCMRQLAQTAKQYGKQAIFETPNPTQDTGGSLDPYTQGMKDVAAQENLPVIDQHAYLMNYLNGKDPHTICPDGLHPTQQVYIMKGQYAASAFVKLFPGN
ncbi:SGNH/GDSL hydrolase family protein [Noviherbaspirillum massiliense]|uniref:SGNH/GDSL hydrolase family protein n=1 Tax=Noviherbaspirillum massiliense TaxID=1465823 RepID=UPI00030571F0|nr:SGNH/GDSL hydrolase family protein [Noviherbaspirillum massiliense]